MKYLIFFCFSALFFAYSTFTYAQCTGDILLSTQENIDNFVSDYGCIELDGSLTIEDLQSTITNLDGLSSLTSINGKLSIIDNQDLNDLNGLLNVLHIGDLEIAHNDSLSNLTGLQNLSTIDGGLSIYNNHNLTNLNGLQNLLSIGGRLWLSNNESLTSLHGLQNLLSIGEEFRILDNRQLSNIDSLQNLSSIEGLVHIDSNDSLTTLNGFQGISEIRSLHISNNLSLINLDGFQNLSNVESHVNIEENASLNNINGLMNLSSIGMAGYGNFNIKDNQSLNNIDGLSNLSFVGTDLIITQNNNLTSVDGLQNLSSVGQDLSISGNQVLTSINGLQSLSSVAQNLSISGNQVLTSINGLQSLSSVGRDLSISGNQVLTSINGLQSLSSVDADFNILENPQLNNISSLSNLMSIGEHFQIVDNDALTNLNSLQNISFIGGNLWISENDSLSACCTVLNMLNVVEGNTTLSTNQPSCNSIEMINEFCSETNTQILAFFDQNENGLFDSNEQTLPLSFEISPFAQHVFTDEDGIANLLLEEQTTYQVSLNNIYPLWTLNSESETFEISFLDNTTTAFLYFPMVPIANFTIQRIDLTSSITRCNQETNYWLTYSNEGTTINSGYVELIPDDSTVFVSADPPVDSIAGDKLYWFYEDLYPTHSNQIHLVYGMPSVEAVGNEIAFEAQVQTNEGLGDNKAILSSELICAYDPNDKLVTPFGYGAENYTLFDDTLEYTVRFQNTGNDTAFTVIIEDELSEHLDLNTFRPIASSHKVATQIDIENRLATFTFNDIYLPDSNVNEVGSHGFVKYRILGKEGLDENTDIENTASIFFDLNPPIITNTTSNRMVEELPSLPVLSATPNQLDFGEVAFDESAYLPQLLLINNLGDLPLHIEQFSFQNPAFNSKDIQSIIVEGLSSVEVPIYFEPTEAGNYQNELILKGPDGELTISLNGTATTNTGINQVRQEYFGLFPNPNNGQFHLQSKNGQMLSYQIQNSLGQVILQNKQLKETEPIDLTKQAKGIYFITVETLEGVFVEKIIVQ